jgi:uncharacterized membrane protein
MLMGRLFWIFMALLIAVSVHIIYVLSVPGLVFQRDVARASRGSEANSMHVLTKAERLGILPAYAGESVTALCRIDLSKGKIALNLKVPVSYWSFAIFTEKGRQVYALNDKQAGAETFDVEISRAKSLIEQVTGVGEPEDAAEEINNSAWSVEMVEQRGIALLWVPLAEPLMRPAIEAIIKESRCGTSKT